VCEIAARKAVAVYKERKLSSGEIIIGADTVVVHGGQLLGKPENKAHARHMLKMLSNNTHDVYTGVTLLYEQNGRLLQHSFSECTRVEFSELSDEETESYIDTDEYRDKAGSYAIQGIFSKHVKGIQGDYNNVVGFPVSRIYRELKAIGLINKD
jgi:septum formation protein